MTKQITSYTYWLEEEDKLLKTMKKAKIPLKDISTALDRSVFSIKNRLKILKLNKRPIEKAVDKKGEVWRKIAGFPEYRVSNFGRVKNAKDELLKSHLSHNGYPRLSIRNGGPSNLMMVHRLVAEAFLEKPIGFDETYQVNHKDGDKENNRKSNLEWVTPAENLQHAVETGLKPRGEACNNAILTEKQVHSICKRLVKGQTVNEIRKQMNLMDLSEQAVRNIRQRKTWKHISENYSW